MAYCGLGVEVNVESTIREKLVKGLTPEHLEVVNESSQHNVPPGSESHFKVVAVSRSFDGLSRVRRHQLVYQLLSEEMKGGVHALALHVYLPDEWALRQNAPESPQCLGGSNSH